MNDVMRFAAVLTMALQCFPTAAQLEAKKQVDRHPWHVPLDTSVEQACCVPKPWNAVDRNALLSIGQASRAGGCDTAWGFFAIAKSATLRAS